MLEEEHGYDNFKQCFPLHKSFYITASWLGIGLAKNPWRNHQQYKISISAPTIICVVIYADYHGKSSISLLQGEGAYEGLDGSISITILSLQDTTRQLVQKPRSIHTHFRWKDNSHPRRAIQVYLEDAGSKYVFVPTVSLLGSEKIDYKFEILYPSNVKVDAEKLPMMDTKVINGEWTKETAGGTIDGIEWRKNPQYLLEVWEPITLYIFLAQHQTLHKMMHNIGFYLIRLNTDKRKKIIDFEYEQVLAQDQGWRKAQEITSKNPLFVEKGLYVVIPCTFYPRKEAKFTLTFACSTISSFSISPLESIYNEVVHEGKWTPELSGGCTQNPDWINNPRYLLTAETDLSITFFIDRKPWLNALRKKPEFVGIYIFKAKANQYASLTKEMLESKTKHFSDSKEVSLKVKHLKRGTYIVLVTTYNALYTGKFLFRAYSVRPFSLVPLPLPPMLSLTDKWNTAGGTFNGGDWRKNSQFFLLLKREPESPPVKVEIILTLEPLPQNPMSPSFTSIEHLTYPYTGFYVFRRPETKSKSKIANITKGDVVKITDFLPKRRIVWTTKLQPDPEKGLVIMPTTFEGNIQSNYSLTVAGVPASDIIFHKIDPNSLITNSLECEWSVEKCTAGGSRHFSRGANEQWLDNPKVIVASKRDTPITVVLKQDMNRKEPVAAGIYILSVKREQKLSKRSVVSHSEFMQSKEVALDFLLVKGEVFMLLFATHQPSTENAFRVDVYSEGDIVWKPLPVKT
eukprot:TRINITY_DN7711_c0_g2_i1.p1 TRINITY_DN7711_c0_g2~~TRINITY_DN7711_c0_g2_i1.p1  ORF type:complete len:801 (+),score=192.26 TRINITY_DN7711_c0_g2_i1:178-2403(+)